MSEKILTYLIYQALFVALFVSCKKSDPSVDDIELSAIPIEFSLADYTAEVKGNALTSSTIADFGVFSLLENTTLGEMTPFMENVEVSKSTSGNSTAWRSDPPYYWPLLPDKRLTFFAYAPYNGAENSSSIYYDGNDRQWKMDVKHNVPENPVQQVDLSVARNLEPKTINDAGEPVDLNFSHTLSSLTFAANYKGTPAENCVLRVTGISLSNIVTSGTLTVDSTQEEGIPWFSWAIDESERGMITMTTFNDALTKRDNVPERNSNNDNHLTLLATDINAYMIPQSVNSDIEGDVSGKSILSLTFSYFLLDSESAGGLKEIAQFSTQMLLPESEWGIASKIKYVFTIDLDNVWLADIKVLADGNIDVWEDSENSHQETIIK